MMISKGENTENYTTMEMLMNMVTFLKDDLYWHATRNLRLSHTQICADYPKLGKYAREELLDNGKLDIPKVERLEKRGITISFLRKKGELWFHTDHGSAVVPV